MLRFDGATFKYKSMISSPDLAEPEGIAFAKNNLYVARYPKFSRVQ